MVAVLNTTEFENIWNTIVNECEGGSDYRKTHFGVGYGFTLLEIEQNKPHGWRELKKLISEIENECVVYYYCKELDRDDMKDLYFIVFGNNAEYNSIRIGVQLKKMHKQIVSVYKLRNEVNNHGTGNISGSVPSQCPLF